MRVISRLLVAVFCLLNVQVVVAEPMQLGSMAKADFSRDFAFSSGMETFIGGEGSRLYFVGKDGAVMVADVEGKRLLTLQAKDAEGNPVLKKPRSVVSAAGLIYVLDSGSNQVAMFNLKGEYQWSFGAGKGGFLVVAVA